jgi:hypothetical protein
MLHACFGLKDFEFLIFNFRSYRDNESCGQFANGAQLSASLRENLTQPSLSGGLCRGGLSRGAGWGPWE